MTRNWKRYPVLFLALLAPGASAHGPVTKKYRTEPPPGTVVPESKVGNLPATTAGSTGAPTTGVQPLRQLAAAATAVVVGDVVRSEVYDEDHLRLHRLGVGRVLRGRLDDMQPGIVEIRGASRRPPLLTEGEHAVFLVMPAPPSSYVAEHLVPEHHFALVAGRDGVIPIASDAELAAVEQSLAAAAVITAPDTAEGRAARRRLAFQELESGSPRLVFDSVLELRGLPEIAPLAEPERTALGRVLADVRVPADTRTRLIELLAARHVVDALPVLVAAAADTPEVLDALLAARTRLGGSPTRADLAGYLTSPVPGVRAAAVRALGRLDDPSALDQVGAYAISDRDPGVRAAAIEALGASGRPAAVPTLARTFASDDRTLKQTSGRALMQIDGPAAADALVDLALHGGSTETQTYAALLLILSRGRNDAAVQRLVASNPGPEVRHLLEHGLEFHESHVH